MKRCCLATRIVQRAKQLCDKHLKELFKMQVVVIKRKIDSVRTSITVDKSPDVLGVATVNTRFTYFDTESNEKWHISLMCDKRMLETVQSEQDAL